MQQKRGLFQPADRDANYLGGILGAVMDFEIHSENFARLYLEGGLPPWAFKKNSNAG
jgi:hypothetical protein